LLGLYVAVAAATAMVIVNTVIRVKQTLGLSDGFVALHFAAYGIGSMLVAISLPRLLARIKARSAMLTGGWMLIVLLALAGLGPNLQAGLVLWSLFGVAASMIQTPVGLLLNRSCNEEDRPALFAAQFSLSHACWLVAYLAAGVLGTKLGLDLTFVLMAVTSTIGIVIAMRYWPADDPVEIEHEHLGFVHEHAFGDSLHHDDECVMSSHPVQHAHRPVRHKHKFVVDDHHPTWPV
jgi:MFS family permease